uniref:Tail-anchored protein insertion receptor WRB n=1 Tax=Picea sitchensis TaxID=3332 RepID=D5AE87_PICSI|nr:unknown [Picea sitchensis]
MNETMDDPKSMISGVQVAAAPLILVVVLIIHIFSGHIQQYLGKLQKRTMNPEEVQVVQEIKRLLKEAKSLSTPSTFAQAAKLRQAAAAKEKELLQIRQKLSVEKGLSSKLHLMAPKILKACIYLGFAWWFWGVPIAVVSTQLLQPFGNAFSLRVGGSTDGLVKIGIIPWLLLTTRVSVFVSRKLVSKHTATVRMKDSVL